MSETVGISLLKSPTTAAAAGAGAAAKVGGTSSGAESPMGLIRWFFVALSCFIAFFVILNLSLHDMINDHSHGSSTSSSSSSSGLARESADSQTQMGHSTLHNVHHFVLNEYTVRGQSLTKGLEGALSGVRGIRDGFIKELEDIREAGVETKEGKVKVNGKGKGKGKVQGANTGADSNALPPPVSSGSSQGTRTSQDSDKDEVKVKEKDNGEKAVKKTEAEPNASALLPPGAKTVAPDADAAPLLSAPKATAGAGTVELAVASTVPDPARTRREVDRLGRQPAAFRNALQAVDVSSGAHLSTRDDISAYLDNGGRIPIALLTCNRAQLLEQTLGSLFAVRGIMKDDVVVLQDGRAPDVEQVARQHGLQLVQNIPANPARLRGTDGAGRIAMHYKFSLSKTFELFPSAPCIIIVEDDLLFSPDFLEYFRAVGPILDVDDSVFVVSSWSDNGYAGKVDDPYALSRTEFFPGLGWLLPRRLYTEELEPQWPSQHWDHWLRSFPINQGREIVTPQVPRTFHNGIKGTFMDLNTHNKYFKNIAYNRDRGIAWPAHGSAGEGGLQPYSLSLSATASTYLRLLPLPSDASSSAGNGISAGSTTAFATAVLPVYEARVENLIRGCEHIRSLEELASSLAASSRPGAGAGADSGAQSRNPQLQAAAVLCVWIDVDPDPQYGAAPFEAISQFFGLWHEHRRGAHKGLHEFYWEGKYILLLNVFASPYLQRREGTRNSRQGNAANADQQQQRSYMQDLYLHVTYSHLKPADVPTLPSRGFLDRSLVHRINDAHAQQELHSTRARIVKAKEAGWSCDDVCGREDWGSSGTSPSWVCKQELLHLANSCKALVDAFGCRGGCGETLVPFGPEHPAAVVAHAPAEHHHPGACALSTNMQMATCDARHELTQRLCVCAPTAHAA